MNRFSRKIAFPYRGKRVTVMGLGLHGGVVSSARFFARAGARVTVTDLKTKRELAPSIKKLRGLPIRYVLGKHDKKDFTGADLVVYNPGVRAKYMRLADSPHLAAAIKHRVPLETDVGIFFKLVNRAQIVGVTGSKGKSTTAALIAHLLKAAYPKTVLAGNIRTSVFDILPQVVKGTPVVLELSSWQLEDLARCKISPRIAVITNVLREHLNAYSSFRAYVEAKKHIVRFQKSGDIAVLNKELQKLPEFRERCGLSRRVWFLWRELGKPYTAHWKLPGIHNRANLAAAIAVARLYGIAQEKILKVLERFEGLEGRLEVVRRVRGVTCINDTTATMPDAVIAALRSLPDPRKIILILGGMDKNLDYRPLAAFLSAYPPKALVLLPGSATVKLETSIRRFPDTIVCSASRMKEAVRSAWRVSQKGDILLLSPGAASFNLFQNEFDRGEQFVREVEKLNA